MKYELDHIDESVVTLDTYNSDLNLVIDASKYSAHSLTQEGFAFMWAGARATHGADKGKFCFEVKVIEHLDVSHLPSDEPNPHVVRVGFSVDSSTLQLGEDPLSYGYGGTGKISTNCQFKDFGPPFMAGDSILAVANIDSDFVQIGYGKNGNFLGWAYKVKKSELQGKALFPHILTKNCSFEVNFGQKDEPYFKLPDAVRDYTFIGCLPLDQRIAGARPPLKREDCEMIMMCGLPGAGKSVWAAEYSLKHPDKKYNVLGTNNIIDKMKVMGLPRKRNYHGRWDVLIQMATKCLNTMFSIGSKLRRNYILDQTNVYPTAQRRKMRNFDGFKRIAVVVVPTEAEYKRRCDKRDREEGKEIPDSAVLEMKTNFKIPEVNDIFDDVIFTELKREEAEELVKKYNEEGKAATGPARKHFRPNEPMKDNKSFNDGKGNFGYNRNDQDNRGPNSYGGNRGGYGRGRGGFDNARGGGYGMRDNYDMGRGPYGGRDSFESGPGGYGGRENFESGPGGFGGRGGFDNSYGGGYDSFGGRGYDNNYGGSGRGGFDSGRGGRGGFDSSRGGRGGFDNGRGGRGSYDSGRGGRGGFDSGPGGRGGSDSSRGGRGGSDSSRGGRGGYDSNRGGRGGLDNNRGGRGGLEGNRGGRGGYDGSRGGRGGYEAGRGGGRGSYDNTRGRTDFDNSRERGGYDSVGGRDSSYGGGRSSYDGGRDTSSTYGSSSYSTGQSGYKGYDEGAGSYPGASRSMSYGGSDYGYGGDSYSSDKSTDRSYGNNTSSDYRRGSANSGYQRGNRGAPSRGGSRGGYSADSSTRDRDYTSTYNPPGKTDAQSSYYNKDYSSGSASYGDYSKYPSSSESTYASRNVQSSYTSTSQPVKSDQYGTGYTGTRPGTRWSAETPQTAPAAVDTSYSARSQNYAYSKNDQTTAGYQGSQTYGYQQGMTGSVSSQPWAGGQAATAATPAAYASSGQSQWMQYGQPASSTQYYSQ